MCIFRTRKSVRGTKQMQFLHPNNSFNFVFFLPYFCDVLHFADGISIIGHVKNERKLKLEFKRGKSRKKDIR